MEASKEFNNSGIQQYEKFLKRMERDLSWYGNSEDRRNAEIGYLMGGLIACFLEIENLKIAIEVLLREKECLEMEIKELK